jgi:hypothetical protein
MTETTEEKPKLIIASPVEEEAEPEDQKDAIEQACMQTMECKPVKNRFDLCTERVNANPETEETCVEVCNVHTHIYTHASNMIII